MVFPVGIRLKPPFEAASGFGGKGMENVFPVPKPKRVKDPKAIRKPRSKYCLWCGIWGVPIERHHIKPKGSGGGDEEENLIDLCTGPPNDCHGKAQRYEITQGQLREAKKKDRELKEWISRMKS